MSDMVPSRWKLAPARSLEIIAYTAADLEYMTGVHKSTWDTWRYEQCGPRWMKVEGGKVLYPADSFREWWKKQLEKNGGPGCESD